LNTQSLQNPAKDKLKMVYMIACNPMTFLELSFYILKKKQLTNFHRITSLPQVLWKFLITACWKIQLQKHTQQVCMIRNFSHAVKPLYLLPWSSTSLLRQWKRSFGFKSVSLQRTVTKEHIWALNKIDNVQKHQVFVYYTITNEMCPHQGIWQCSNLQL